MEQNEYESDAFLVAIVRMQRVLCRIHAALPDPELDKDGPNPFYPHHRVLMMTIRDELDAVKAECPLDIQNHCTSSPFDLPAACGTNPTKG